MARDTASVALTHPAAKSERAQPDWCQLTTDPLHLHSFQLKSSKGSSVPTTLRHRVVAALALLPQAPRMRSTPALLVALVVIFAPASLACENEKGETGPCGPLFPRCGKPLDPQPAYHVTDLTCGENDPNGPVYDPVHGVYHVFYQDHIAMKVSARGGPPGSRGPEPGCRRARSRSPTGLRILARTGDRGRVGGGCWLQCTVV